MKKYKLKEEVKKYFTKQVRNKVSPLREWYSADIEALEEVKDKEVKKG